ncbi:MAG: hypothetical protein CMQ69_05390 [Gammaproteobacteria bacterium]|nr:hypothetical protein [Gammaproteobacteria bacterium]
MFVLDILPSRVALTVLCAVHGMAVLALCIAELPVWLVAGSLVVMVLTRKRRISEELAVSPRRFRRCLAGEMRCHLENAAGRVTVLPPRPIFISELLIVLEFPTCLDTQIEGPNKLCLCLFSDNQSPSQSSRLRCFLRFPDQMIPEG